MLILTRKPGESLFIGDTVKVTIVEIKGNQIRVGIDAPKELRIYREEIYLQILEENRSAASVGGKELESLPSWPGKKSSSGLKAPKAGVEGEAKEFLGQSAARGRGVDEKTSGEGERPERSETKNVESLAEATQGMRLFFQAPGEEAKLLESHTLMNEPRRPAVSRLSGGGFRTKRAGMSGKEGSVEVVTKKKRKKLRPDLENQDLEDEGGA